MPVLVDGNNVLHRLPMARRSRRELRRIALDYARRRGTKVTVIFDGPPPPGVPARESLGSVTVVYSEERTADELILARLPGGPVVKSWVVVTDDRELGRRVRHSGAELEAAAAWLSRLEKARVQHRTNERLSADEVAQWEAYFASGRDDDHGGD